LSSLTETERNRLTRALTPRTTEYTKIGLKNPRQVSFLLMNDVLEILFGGAAGGGKSIGLLAAASQFVDVPGYSALLLRRRFRDLALPGALMDVAFKWWRNTDAHWDRQNYNWTFPSSAIVQFGYLAHDGDEEQYQSAAFSYIGFDEVTQHTEEQYTYMFSRLRRPEDIDNDNPLANVPLRFRASANPGGPGHEWVKKRFGIHMVGTHAIGVRTKERLFIASRLEDNPYLDKETYERSLDQLSPVTRAQLRSGDWAAHSYGGIFDPAHFTVISATDIPDRRYWKGIVRHWDLAATEPNESDPNPDYTVGLKMIKTTMPPTSILEYFRTKSEPLPPPPYWVILNVVRDRKKASGVEDMVSTTAHLDGLMVPISIEQERGAAGKLAIDSYRRHVVPGFKVIRLWTTGDKVERAKLIAGPAGKGRVFVVDGPYVGAFLDEVGIFSGKKGVHDDQVDALSGAYIQLERMETTGSEVQGEQY